jgi:hypothetical protein
MTEHKDNNGTELPDPDLIASHTAIIKAARRRKHHRNGVRDEAKAKDHELIPVQIMLSKQTFERIFSFKWKMLLDATEIVHLVAGADFDEEGELSDALTPLALRLGKQFVNFPGVESVIVYGPYDLGIIVGYLFVEDWPQIEDGLLLVVQRVTGIPAEDFVITRGYAQASTPDEEPDEATDDTAEDPPNDLAA